VSKWDLKHPQLCVITARLLAFAGKHSEALAGFDKVGRDLKGVSRIVAAEGIGDMMFSLKRWEQSVNNFKFALKTIQYLKKQSEYQNDPDKLIAILEKRIRKKLSAAEKAWDEERYGPGFVAYREARSFELKKDYLKAAALFRRIPNQFPGTVYADAAVLYGNNSLLQLAEPARRRIAEKAIEDIGSRLSKERRLFNKSADKMTIRTRELYELELNKDELLLVEIKDIPLGKKAIPTAAKALNSFIFENRYGPYRGEAMQLLGDHFLETELDVEKAYRYYGDCYKWLGEIRKQKPALDAYRVPQKAASVTRPPIAEKELTGWIANITKTKIKPEQIINRLHCSWYLDSLRARNGKMLSLCFFIKGDQEQALNATKAILKYEPLEKMFYQKGAPNSYNRLYQGYKKGWLCTPPDQLSLFQNRKKLAVILGDFYFEIEDEEKCRKIRERMLAEKYGSLNREQEACARYKLAEIAYRQFDFETVKSILNDFTLNKYKGCLARADALIGLGNVYIQDNKATSTAISCYEMAARCANGLKKEMALYYTANAYALLKDEKNALYKYKEVLKLNPDTTFRNLCHEKIRKLEKNKQEINQ